MQRPLHGHSSHCCIEMVFCQVLNLRLRLNVISWGDWLHVESLRLQHTMNSLNAFKKANQIKSNTGIWMKNDAGKGGRGNRVSVRWEPGVQFDHKCGNGDRGMMKRTKGHRWGCEDMRQIECEDADVEMGTIQINQTWEQQFEHEKSNSNAKMGRRDGGQFKRFVVLGGLWVETMIPLEQVSTLRLKPKQPPSQALTHLNVLMIHWLEPRQLLTLI